MKPGHWIGPVALYLAAVGAAEFVLFPQVPHRSGPLWWLLFAATLGLLMLTPALMNWLASQLQALPLPPTRQRRLMAWKETAMISVLAVTAANLLVALQRRQDFAETLLVLGFFLLLWRLRRWLP